MQQQKHQHYISGLQYKLEKETHGAAGNAEAERYHYEFEVKALAEELDARIRIRWGEEERMIVRKDCHDREIVTLNQNLDKSEHLIDHSKEQMVSELRNRDEAWLKMMAETKHAYEARIASMKDDYEKAISSMHEQIEAAERELDSNILFITSFSIQQ
jgi:hypothetical protein